MDGFPAEPVPVPGAVVAVVVTAADLGVQCALHFPFLAVLAVPVFLIWTCLLGAALGRRAALRAGLTPVPSRVYRHPATWPWRVR